MPPIDVNVGTLKALQKLFIPLMGYRRALLFAMRVADTLDLGSYTWRVGGIVFHAQIGE
jgi:hypothetical protein